ncbi:MAG: FtsW/RodA/SpoVE family cell cycle protein [Candidatus Pacebacteria bacterium]|nr:FtsW/RodA/SpoVE family cell cycle protein [Candidatus Paceibacterota bacterium]PIR60712.1 MAG: hypothetical protein COU67_01120 [Candidatus Pacebacteria bacterium CG10_big_fil_rev_8_21_14_0_10_44_54]
MKQFFLPTLLGCFAILSVTTLYGLNTALALRQLVFFLVGFGIFFVCQSIDFSRMISLSGLFYALAILLLVIVLVFSSEIRNTNRWISLGFFNLQPSQLAVPALALLLAKISSQTKNRGVLLKILGITLLPAVLIFLEPDLSMTLIVMLTASASIWFQPISPKAYLSGGVVLAVLLSVSWIWLLQPYQKERLRSFFSPSDTITTASYNVQQSKIAVGSGMLFGRGMQQGTQSQLQFLPENETDFIFATFSEEFGWLGAMFVLCLYAGLLTYLLQVSKRVNEPIEQTFLISVFVVFLSQISINVGMNLGLLPVTGVALPLLSYGGSSLLVTCFIFGIVQSIAARTTLRSQLQIE